MVSVTQLYLLPCVMMITVEGVFKKKRKKKQFKIKMCCVLWQCAREKGGGGREI